MLVVLTYGYHDRVRYISAEIPCCRLASLGEVADLVIHAFKTYIVWVMKISCTVKKGNSPLAYVVYLRIKTARSLHNKAVPYVVESAFVVFGVALSDIVQRLDHLACANAVAVDLYFHFGQRLRSDKFSVGFKLFKKEGLIARVAFVDNYRMLAVLQAFCGCNGNILAVVFGREGDTAHFSVNNHSKLKTAPQYAAVYYSF